LPLFAMPEGIDMTDPSDIVMPGSIIAEVCELVGVETAMAATGLLFHSMVIGARDAVGIGFMLGAEVTLDRCAKTAGATAARARVMAVEVCITFDEGR
jgi:hypothetical protein